MYSIFKLFLAAKKMFLFVPVACLRDAELRDSLLEGCIVKGAQITGATLSGCYTTDGVSMKDCKFDGTAVIGGCMEGNKTNKI